MYICERCKTQQPKHTACMLTPVEVRIKTYHYTDKKKRARTSTGWEIEREAKLCRKCSDAVRARKVEDK